MYRTFIFFRAGLCSVSPAVTFRWPGKVVTLLNRLPVGALHYGAGAAHACGDFIGACRSVPGLESVGIEVGNLRLRWDREDALPGEVGTREYEDRWRAWLFEEIERMSVEVDRQWLP